MHPMDKRNGIPDPWQEEYNREQREFDIIIGFICIVGALCVTWMWFG